MKKLRAQWQRIVCAILLAVFAGAAVVGFWVDGVSTAERGVGQTLSTFAACVTAWLLGTRRGRARLDRPPRQPDLGDPKEQWAVFFQVCVVVAVALTFVSLDLHPWSLVTIGWPVGALVGAGVTWAARGWVTKSQA